VELVTRFPDGTTVTAIPAADHDTFEQLHDATHLLLAKALNLPTSPVLWRKAHGQPLDSDLTRYEEAAVQAICAYTQALARVV
jgi:hypothetical protein